MIARKPGPARPGDEPSAAVAFVLHGASERAGADGATRAAGAAAAAPPAGLLRGEARHRFVMSAGPALRSAGPAAGQRVLAVPGRDVVVLHIAGGPSLVLHPEHARDLLRAQQPAAGSTPLSRSQRRANDETSVPAELRWQAVERPPAEPAEGSSQRDALTRGVFGVVGSVLLAGLDIVRDPAGGSLADMAAEKVAARIDAQVSPGVYALQAHALPGLKDSGRAPLAAVPAGDGPLLVFVHGTFSHTAGTFGKLWQHHPQRVAALFRHYGDRVYGLDHPTLLASPVTNALMLARALPVGARVHLVTHSRGGLVAEVLARAAANPALKGEDLRAFSATEQRDVKALAALLADKQVRVERVVRVACPARGTLLASKRLDAYLSVFKWTLELAAVPVLPALVELLAVVAQRRADATRLPGLAAQVPDSALIQWLHASEDALPGQLRVVAGDVQGDSVGSWLKTLLADSFYWTDNDFVVQTRSMYGGAPRAGGALFLLDRGARVAHTGYFAAERSAEAVCNALMHDQPAGFATIGPLSWAGESATGTRAARRSAEDAMPASDKPAAILLPGICGSHLAVDGKRIWLSLRLVGGLKRLAWPQAKNVTADGAVGPIYDALAEHLAATHEVIEFSYDWRRPLEDEARRLAQVAEAALAARQGSGQPVRFVAHSMGGLVVRTLQLEAPPLFERLMAHDGARVLMLGTPNAGSWAPMQVLSGDDTFGNTLVAFGAPFQDREVRALMAAMPGLLQLQADLRDADKGLAERATWQRLADEDLAAVREHHWWHNDETQLAAYAWGVPPQSVLDAALRLRERLDAQRDTDLPRFAEKMVLVTGRARFTPDGFAFDANEGLSYLNAVEAGDGRVTRASARLPGVRNWSVDCEHGQLADHEAAFAAYVELLDSGTTTLLSRQDDVAPPSRTAAVIDKRATARWVKSRPSREASALRPPQRETELGALAAAPAERVAAAPGVPALAVAVLNGNLMFVRQALLVGHYRSTQLSGSEAVVNTLLGGTMAASLGAGVYPDGAGAFQMFRNTRGSDNPLQLPRPGWAVVVGLGDETELKPQSLVHAVRQAIIGWAQRIAEGGHGPQSFELASTLMGSGGTRITPGQSAQLIAQAAREANLRLKASGWPLLAQLTLVELYLDRASEAWRSLQELAQPRPAEWRMAAHVASGAGALRRPLDTGYRGADYDLISATSVQTHVEGRGFDAAIAYTLDTRRARTEVRAQAAQAQLVRELVKRAGNDRNQDPQIGRTLYQLLVPVEMDPYLGGTTEARIELDSGTAGIPWELLHDTPGGQRLPGSEEDALPWSIRTKLLRKLRTTRFRQTVTDAGVDSGALVIGEPAVTDGARYPRLPGARHEARAVRDRLTGTGAFDSADVRALIAEDDAATAPDAHRVINALLERDWRIVHIAGHGEPPERVARPVADGSGPLMMEGDPRGVVLSHGCYLGPREIRTMRTVPELVFVNCCHLAERDAAQLLGSEYDRAQFASGVAEELIKLGVRCVVAAGWAVEDLPAQTFAISFYDALLAGARFIDAAARARRAAWDVRGQGNTWAAYQCYGDPEWTLKRERSEKRATPPADKFAGISSPLGLAIALETVAVETRFLRADERELRLPTQRERLTWLEARFAPEWGGMGAVAEAFALAWEEAGQTERALDWYTRAVAANDASASQRALEQWANLQARQAESVVRDAGLARDAARRRLARGHKTAPTEKDREHAQASERAVVAAAAAARAPLLKALATLEQLIALQPTMERAGLAGSACKRLALVEAEAGRRVEAAAAVQRMHAHYARAEAIGRAADSPQLYYPALNRMAAELVDRAGTPGWRGLDRASIAFVRQLLASRTRDDPDFWSVAGLTELRVYEAVAQGTLAGALAAVLREYDDLHHRVSGTHDWRSLYDTARFVLEAYGERAAAAEKKACATLIELLEGFAWPQQ